MSSAERKAELERKKAKLEALKLEKERRRLERDKKEREAAAHALKSNDTPQPTVDELLRNAGINPITDVLSSLNSQASQPTDDSLPSSGHSINHDLPSSSQHHTPVKRRKQLSSVLNVQQTNIPPKELVSYEKQTQTQTLSGVENRAAHGFDYYAITYDIGDDDSLTMLNSSTPPVYNKLPPGVLHPGMPNVVDVVPAETPSTEKKPIELAKPPKKVQELSDEEKQMIMLTNEFQTFFDKSSTIMERALSEDVNIFMDYSGVDDVDLDADEKRKAQVSLNRCFYDERWSRHRVVTSLDTSPQHPELIVAAYNNNEEAPHEPDGVALVWNMRYKKDTPEYIFHCQSKVLSSIFARFHPNLILGGTYSGQIVLWDNRVQKRTPVQRSPLSAAAHTHPVYCLKVVGTQNAHNLISISTDGRLCSWSLDMLAQPQEALELQHKQSRNVAVPCFDFPVADVNNFIVGSEEGTVYTACRHGSRAGVLDQYEGHQAPVTGISCHKATGIADFSHLFVTSSFDWTIKLWSQKEHKPLYSFDNYGEYVYDVAWSPIHPALFAAVDGSGQIDLWNINHDSEVPTASVEVEGYPALNRVSWNQTGTQLIVGDDQGKVWLYDVAEQLATPRHEEWQRLVHNLTEFKNNAADEDRDLKHSTLSSHPFR